MIYLDSSAILELIQPERESTALFAYLGDHADAALLTSELSTVEVHRALIRVGHSPEDAPHRLATFVLDGMERLAFAPVVDVAAMLPGPLRSLDALHLATARTPRPPRIRQLRPALVAGGRIGRTPRRCADLISPARG